MIGYVLLVAMAIALSAGVYIYLKNYLPSNTPTCPEDAKLSIDEVVCVQTSASTSTNPQYDVYVNITNRGLFTVDSAYIKIGDQNRVFKKLLEPDVNSRWNNGLSSSTCTIGAELKPSEKFCGLYQPSTTIAVGATQEVSVEPLIWIDNKPVVCQGAVAIKTVVCQ